MEYNSDTQKKNEILPFMATWMELGGLMLSKISQEQKVKYCMFLLMQKLKNVYLRRVKGRTEVIRSLEG